MSVNLVWFRNDLRVEDNPALWNAAERRERVIGLFVLTPDQWRSHAMAGCRANFLLESLRLLRADLSRLGIPLQVLFGSDFSRIPQQVLAECKAHRVDAVYWNNEYPWDEVERDKAVEKLLVDHRIECHRYHDRMLLPPHQMLTGQGEPYKVFTPFKKKVLARFDEGLPDLFPAPAKRHRHNIWLADIPRSLSGFDSHIDDGLWPAGEGEARRRLELFVNNGIEHYHKQRDYPALEGTSTLSPYLAVGSLSPQQCLLAALSGPRGAGADGWIGELIWRDFYQYVAWHFPRVCKHRPFNEATEGVRWRRSEADFEAWKSGATGVPLVDAGMRQLQATGWMHNRVRMVVAMFLSKNLLLDWREGERFFMNRLVDGDFCANNGGWQWSASTGTDAAPYFRIFNPFTQGEKFDPEARYIKRFVPELEALDPAAIHKPTRLHSRRSKAYPDVIVDLKGSRERAITAFREIKS